MPFEILDDDAYALDVTADAVSDAERWPAGYTEAVGQPVTALTGVAPLRHTP
jgi:hypothetical protein